MHVLLFFRVPSEPHVSTSDRLIAAHVLLHTNGALQLRAEGILGEVISVLPDSNLQVLISVVYASQKKAILMQWCIVVCVYWCSCMVYVNPFMLIRIMEAF